MHAGSANVGQSRYDAGALVNPREVILPRPGGFRAVLNSRDFRLLWSAQVASQLADKFLMFSLLILTYSISGESLHGASLFLPYTVPSVFLSPRAGVYADRHDKKRLMFWTNVIRGLLILLIPLSRYTPYFQSVTWHLLVITFLFSAVGQVFAPAEAASIPFIVGREELMTATSVFTSTVIVTLLVAVPVSTLAVRFLGTDSPYWIGTILFGLAAGFIALLSRPLKPPPIKVVSSPDLLFELREGLRYITSRPLVRFAVIQLSLTITVVFSVFVLAPQYMSTVLGLRPTDVYLFLAPAVAGMLATAVVLGQFGGRIHRARLLTWGLVGGGFTLILIALVPGFLQRFVPSLLIAFPPVFGFIGGVAFGTLFIPAFTVLQEKTEPEVRGRIFGALFTVVNAAVAIPILLAGELAGVTRVIFAMGVILILTALAALLTGRSPVGPVRNSRLSRL